jgi:peptidoglycan/xylan/chitin deacetylase (PgdA/CDA1 family)
VIVVGLLVGAAGCAGHVSGSGTPPPTATRTTSASGSPSAPSSPVLETPAGTGSSTPRPSTPGPSTPRPSTSAPPSPGLASWLRGRDWTHIPTERRVVALTFDAGGNAAGVASILGTLARDHVRATFFVTASWARAYPAQAHAICAAGRVGNHSVSHPHFTQLSAAQIRAEVLDAATVLRRTCGANPAPLFRFPYGDRDSRTIGAVNSLGYVPVSWTVDTLGWEGTNAGISGASVIARVVAHAQPGEIVLMHVGGNPDDGSTLDADALPAMIDALRSRSFSFVSLDALLTAA